MLRKGVSSLDKFTLLVQLARILNLLSFGTRLFKIIRAGKSVRIFAILENTFFCPVIFLLAAGRIIRVV